MGLFSDPPNDEEPEVVYPEPSTLLQEIELASADMLDENAGDYGYGGEWFPRTEIDAYAIERFILERETRLLGMELEDFIAQHPEIAAAAQARD